MDTLSQSVSNLKILFSPFWSQCGERIFILIQKRQFRCIHQEYKNVLFFAFDARAQDIYSEMSRRPLRKKMFN